jgi:hypothetical protein
VVAGLTIVMTGRLLAKAPRTNTNTVERVLELEKAGA